MGMPLPASLPPPHPRENFGIRDKSAKRGSAPNHPTSTNQWANPQGQRLAPSASMGPLPQAADEQSKQKYLYPNTVYSTV